MIPTRDQIRAAIVTAGGSIDENQLLQLAPAGEKSALIEELRAMEEDGLLVGEVSVTWGVVR